MTSNELKYLFCIGAQKAGTTYLFHLLKQHSNIAVSRFKELHFFNRYFEYRKGLKGFTKKYDIRLETKYLADFTPDYMLTPRYLKRIFETAGDEAKIIVLLREPVGRAFSQYKMKLKNSNTTPGFNELIKRELSGKKKATGLTGRGLYASQLEHVFDTFKAENVILVRFEDLTQDTETTLQRIIDFLNISKKAINTDVSSNPAKKTIVSGPLKLYFKIPFVIRRKLYDFSPWLKNKIKKVIDSSTKIQNVEITIDNETKSILKSYYRESNLLLKSKYKIDTDEWL